MYDLTAKPNGTIWFLLLYLMFQTSTLSFCPAISNDHIFTSPAEAMPLLISTVNVLLKGKRAFVVSAGSEYVEYARIPHEL